MTQSFGMGRSIAELKLTPEGLRALLEGVASGGVSPDEALERLRDLPFADLGAARLDLHRELRRSLPEALFCQGKNRTQVAEIAAKILDRTGRLLATRVGDEHLKAIREVSKDIQYHELARVVTYGGREMAKDVGEILVLAAGTSDLPVAEEAAVTGEFLGNRVGRYYDVGIAGLHRILGLRDQLSGAQVLIVVAGMEGALPSVVAGLTDRPVIGVPTSVGYGASFGGLAALLGMLNSCASGVVVVNIDNGFGAACAAHLINRS